MLNFTWASAHRSRHAELQAPYHATSDALNDTVLHASQSAYQHTAMHSSTNTPVPVSFNASGQGISYLRKNALDHAQRLGDRSIRPAASRQQAMRVFHAAAMGRCRDPETAAVDPTSGTFVVAAATDAARSAPGSATYPDPADGHDPSSTAQPGTMRHRLSPALVELQASFVGTLISPGFFLIRPPHAFLESIHGAPSKANASTVVRGIPFRDNVDRYGEPAYELLSAIVGGTQLHENFLYVSQVVREFASNMNSPARQVLNKSGEFFELLAGLNAMLAGKHRLTSLTLVVLQVMRRNAVDYDEAIMLDGALQSVTALDLAQRQLRENERRVMRATTLADAIDVTISPHSASPLPHRADIFVTFSGAPEEVSKPVASTPFVSTVLTPTVAAPFEGETFEAGLVEPVQQNACNFGVERADEAHWEGGPTSRIWLDGIPMMRAPDAAGTLAWRPVPLAPYKVSIAAQIDMPANASMCADRNGHSYIGIGDSIYRVVETPFGTLRVVGPEDQALPPLPIVKRHEGWDFAWPDDETDGGDGAPHLLLNAVPIPSEDGFVRWKNKKYVCYGEQLRPVDASAIHGEEKIRTMAIAIMERLDQPDEGGILRGPNGERLIEGQYGYYALHDGPPRMGLQGSVYRIGDDGASTIARVSYDRVRQRWHVLGAQRTDMWFSNAFDAASDIGAADHPQRPHRPHRRQRHLNARLALRLDASAQALPDAPFLKTRKTLRDTLQRTSTTLARRILRGQSRPSTWSSDEQARLRAVWTALTNLLPPAEHWDQMPLIARQRLLAENVALFYDEFAPSFPLNGVLHQVQMTALGMTALDETLPRNTVVQLSARLTTADGVAPFMTDLLLYADSPALVASFVHPVKHDNGTQDAAHWHRASFADWLYDNRASVALINFSARRGLCSFEDALSADQVAQAVDLFLWEMLNPEGSSFTISPCNATLTNIIGTT